MRWPLCSSSRARSRSFEEGRGDRSTAESTCRSGHDPFFSILLGLAIPRCSCRLAYDLRSAAVGFGRVVADYRPAKRLAKVSIPP